MGSEFARWMFTRKIVQGGEVIHSCDLVGYCSAGSECVLFGKRTRPERAIDGSVEIKNLKIWHSAENIWNFSEIAVVVDYQSELFDG